MQSMRKRSLVTAVLLCLSGTAAAQTDAAAPALAGDESPAQQGGFDQSDISSPHQAPTAYDLPKIFRPILSPDAPESTGADGAAETLTRTGQNQDEEPLPWDEFFRMMSETASIQTPSAGGTSVQSALQAQPKPSSILVPEGGMASRLVGAFRVRREKEQAFRDYAQQQSTEERLISRLDGILGNTALIVVTDRFERTSPDKRHEAAMRWGNKWAEINDTQISRLVLFSLKQGELVAYDIVTDRHAPPTDGSTPLAMLSRRDAPIGATDAGDAEEETAAPDAAIPPSQQEPDPEVESRPSVGDGEAGDAGEPTPAQDVALPQPGPLQEPDQDADPPPSPASSLAAP